MDLNADIVPISKKDAAKKKESRKREHSPKPAHDAHVKAEVTDEDTTVLRAAAHTGGEPDAVATGDPMDVKKAHTEAHHDHKPVQPGDSLRRGRVAQRERRGHVQRVHRRRVHVH